MATSRKELEELRALARLKDQTIAPPVGINQPAGAPAMPGIDRGAQPIIPSAPPRQELEQLRSLSQEAAQVASRSEAETEALRRGAIEELPELGGGGLLSGEDPARIAAITPVLLTTTDPRELGDVLSTNFDIGVTETPEGELLATNRRTGARVIINRPGITKLDVLQGLGVITAFTPGGLARTVPARIAGAALTETGIQAGQAVAGGELDPEDVALATGLAGAGEVIAGPVMQTLRQRRQARQLGTTGEEFAEVAPAVREAQEAAVATGIQPFEAQATAVPSRLEEQAFVASLPAGARTARTAILRQNEQAAKAVDDILDQIAPPTALETGPERFRAVAQKARDSNLAIRKERTSPLFKEAFKSKDVIDTSPVKQSINEIIEDFPEGGEVARTLGKISKLIKGDKNTRQLHNAKLEIDQMFAKIGEGSLGNTTKAKIIDVKNQLLEIIDEANPAYRQAREEFARLSPEVNRFEQSVLGKIAAFKDPQLKTISRQIFDPAETNPQIIAQARKTVESIDPQAWREIMRTELERRLGAVRADAESAAQGVSASIENLPSQLVRAIYGNEKQRRVLFQGSPQDVAQSLKYLETALGRAALGRPGGSQTAAREEIKKQLRPGVGQSIRKFLQQPITTITGIGEEAAFNRRVSSLSKTLYDPEWKSRMTEIRRMNPFSEAAGKAMLQLLNDVEQTEE